MQQVYNLFGEAMSISAWLGWSVRMLRLTWLSEEGKKILGVWRICFAFYFRYLKNAKQEAMYTLGSREWVFFVFQIEKLWKEKKARWLSFSFNEWLPPRNMEVCRWTTEAAGWSCPRAGRKTTSNSIHQKVSSMRAGTTGPWISWAKSRVWYVEHAQKINKFRIMSESISFEI